MVVGMLKLNAMDKKYILLFFILIFVIYTYQNFDKLSQNLIGMNTIKSSNIYAILAIGDSLTEGLYSWPKSKKFHPYTTRLQTLLSKTFHHVEVTNAGISGNRVKDIRLRLRKQLKTKPYKLVLILAGTNDYIYIVKKIKRNVADFKHFTHSVKQIANNIEELHSICHKERIRTAVITIPPIQLEHQARIFTRYRSFINSLLKQYAESHRNVTVFIDLAASIEKQSSGENEMKLWDDNVHFTPEGYDKMADIIYDALKDYL
ncbi:uncharacterized protein LOC130636286 [Hydractinia symbiolongicarpus]|uniref:uncharacterized protein LOC130636286 n=1 Tax=Hydractinia symbiolongicarpus TaxID=13093 RepID=UPI00254B8393|nr:uncharacterized protein LOC130636286 [Hydractinia symbiolongicarpus]